MKQKLLRISVVVTSVFFIWVANVSLAADYRPAMLANPCAGCHGTDGASPGSIPSIKGLSSSHLVSVMKAFKSGERKGTVMNRIARGYTDEEIELMAKHFSSAK